MNETSLYPKRAPRMSEASAAQQVKQDRLYTKEHEWVKVEGDELVVGITAFAVDQLGDITLVNWDVEEGQRVEAGAVFGTIESVKTLSDLYCPVTGSIKRINPALEDGPELLNDDTWEQGWMLVITPDEPDVASPLLSPEQYAQFIAELDG